jgi:predicted Zn-dependent peptidase
MNIDRTKHPKYNNIEHINFPDVKKISLDNGIPVYIINGCTQNIFKLDLMIGAGAAYGNDRLTAPLTNLMLNEGTKKHSAQEIAEIFDYYGAYFQPSTEKDMAFGSIISLNKHINKTLPLFAEIINESIFPEKELKILLDRQKHNFLIDLEKTSFVAREIFNQKLFGNNHPYGKRMSIDLYDRVLRDDIVSFYKKYYTPSNFGFILSGKITDKHINLLNELFGQLTISKKPVVEKVAINPQFSETPYVSEKNSALQSSIRAGIITVTKTHPDYYNLRILTTILGGYFGSRLMKNIREDKGYTYGINALQVSFIQAGFIGIMTDVKSETTKNTIDEIYKEIERLKVEKIGDDELNLVRNYMMGEFMEMFDGPFAVSDTFKAVLQYDMGFEYFKNFKQKILTITPGELIETANKYLDTNKIITVVSGKL